MTWDWWNILHAALYLATGAYLVHAWVKTGRGLWGRATAWCRGVFRRELRDEEIPARPDNWPVAGSVTGRWVPGNPRPSGPPIAGTRHENVMVQRVVADVAGASGLGLEGMDLSSLEQRVMGMVRANGGHLVDNLMGDNAILAAMLETTHQGQPSDTPDTWRSLDVGREVGHEDMVVHMGSSLPDPDDTECDCFIVPGNHGDDTRYFTVGEDGTWTDIPDVMGEPDDRVVMLRGDVMVTLQATYMPRLHWAIATVKKAMAAGQIKTWEDLPEDFLEWLGDLDEEQLFALSPVLGLDDLAEAADRHKVMPLRSGVRDLDL